VCEEEVELVEEGELCELVDDDEDVGVLVGVDVGVELCELVGVDV
jgi:hypothetical protein